MTSVPYSRLKVTEQPPVHSYLACDERKLKCDRLKPCASCRSQGVLSQRTCTCTIKDDITSEPNDTREQLTTKSPKLKIERGLANTKATRCIACLSSPSGHAERNISLSSSIPTTSIVLENVLQRLLDAYCSKTENTQIQPAVLEQVASLRHSSPLICEALWAASLLIIGRSDSNPGLVSAGFLYYNKAIRLLGRLLSQLSGQLSLEALGATYLFGVIEMSTSSHTALLKHAGWALHLLQRRSPQLHQTGLGKSLFLDVRIYWVTFAILRRRRTLLATEEWLAIPWVNDKRPKDILQQLLDIASGVPSFLAELDYIMSMVNENCLSPLEMRTQQGKLNARADKTFRQLDAWKESVASAYPPGSISKSPAPYKDDFPIFQCYNPKTEVEFATHYEYPNVILAHTMCYYWALLLVISEPTPIPLHSLKPCERYTIACNICRSIRYFIYAAPKNLIYRLLFPLLIAHSVFVPGSVEMEFLRDVSNYIERHFRTAIFTSMMGSLSDVDYRELSKLF
ncbi:hypothetical protein BDV23DRAFT_163516 [Aspergillus alliaceus]|uniref:Zn(2)-C6 fungal-type domain-containing protein n=1 Tax=Petromyces alliaceus TaxID=209559 RepID=A0A5N7BWV3_PETAA|nr:hypothetical protein BDV23DRAFT_163516 [Aspergillus alliaceus]